MKKLLLVIISFFLLPLFHGQAFAAEPLSTIRLKTDFNIWKVDLKRHQWLAETEKLSWFGIEVALPSDLVATSSLSPVDYLSNQTVSDIDEEAVRAYLNKYAAPELHREKQDVSISLDVDGKAVFEGFAINGQEIDFEKAFKVIREAVNTGESEVRLPLKTIPPVINVDDQLKEMGVVDLIAFGETDYSGSPYNRRNNIRVGLNRFSGWLIPPNETVSAIQRLGAVNQATGYLPELVIKGDKTIPEYGGGLCQVSTTLYRSVLFAGLPINERRNHSYAVSYYDPQGLDATIYIPSPDLKFTNDTENHILIQTLMKDGKAFSNVYGTTMNRQVDLIGPFYYDYIRAPAPKVEYTDQLAPGEKQRVSGVHTGFKADWYRRIIYTEEERDEAVERIHSSYSARGSVTLIGEQPSEPFEISENGT